MSTNKVNVTAITPSNGDLTIANGTGISISLGTGWSNYNKFILTDNAVIMLGYGISAQIKRCTDLTGFATWSTVTLTSSGTWYYGATGGGTVVLMGYDSTGSNFQTAYSIDGGANFTVNTGMYTVTQFNGQGITYGNGMFIIVGTGTSGTLLKSTNGVTWSFISAGKPNAVVKRLLYNSIMNKWLTEDSGNGTGYVSTDGTATAWTNIATNLNTNEQGIGGGTVDSTFSYSNMFIASCQIPTGSGVTNLRISTDGINWTTIYRGTNSRWLEGGIVYNNILYMNNYSSGKLDYLSGTSFHAALSGAIPANTAIGPRFYNCNNASNVYPNILSNIWLTINSNLLYETTISGFSGLTRYVDVTATKGTTIINRRLNISQSSVPNPVYSISVQPGGIMLGSTIDGFVYPESFTNANSTITVFKNGIDDTSNWSFSKTDPSGITSSITGSILTVSAVTTAAATTSTISITASPITTSASLLTTGVLIQKTSDTGMSGIIGAAFGMFSTTTSTSISIKFLVNGYFQIKYGAGTYTNAGMWYSPADQTGTRGGTYYMIVNYLGSTVTTGTGGILGGGAWTTWNQMNTPREYTLTGSTTGTYTANLEIAFATSSAGANAVIGIGTLQVVIP